MSDDSKKTECEVCGNFKMPHEKFCRECQEHKDTRDAVDRQKARDRRFGRIWG